MIVSIAWLADYVQLPGSVDELVERLLMSGLNHESTRAVGTDTAVELEVTSNRPDCLGHIGVAREVAVLYGRPLHLPDPQPVERGPEASAGVAVEILAVDCCPCYTARVIRGVRVGPSPQWLVDRLRTVGLASVNNIVDITNYVMLESGQPLHAFDLAKIRGGTLTVRRARDGEAFTAINHKAYTLDERMCVIADAGGPLALAGVMGGAESEIGPATTDILIESAQFAPLPVRAAARGLVLASASSYRFERGPDPAMVDWASRRTASLILELAGGTLDRGCVTAGRLASPAAEILLAPTRVAEVLGVDVPAERQHRILTGLGFVEQSSPAGSLWRAPSWRRDASRAIDLVEEIARIQGYEHVPEDTPIEARAVELSDRELTVRRAGESLVAAGFCEAMTRSVVTADLAAVPSPWSDATPLAIAPPLVRGADRLRRSLLPSLLEARATNAAAGSSDADLFEIARAYIPHGPGSVPGVGPLEEPLLLTFVTGGDFFRAKGLSSAVLARLGIGAAEAAGELRVSYRPLAGSPFAAGRAAEIVLERPGRAAERVGVVGEVVSTMLAERGLEGDVSAAELRLDRLEFAARLERPLRRPSDFPALQRDLNLVVDAGVPWSDIEAAIRESAAGLLEECRVAEVWQDTDRLGVGKKSVVVALRLRSDVGTLTSDAASRAVDAMVAECGRRVGAVLRS